MSNVSKIWIVTQVFNGGAVARNFIKLLRGQSFENWCLVITDHGKTLTDFGNNLDEKVIILRGTPQMWWTAATNLALKYALENGLDKDRVLVVNYDINIDRDYLSNIYKASIKHPNGFVGSVCVDTLTGRIQYAGHRLDKIRARTKPICNGGELQEVADIMIPCDFLSGRGVIASLKAYREVGLFDERLEHYGADFEYAWRAKEKGYMLITDGNCVVSTESKPERLYVFTGSIKQFFCDIKKPGNLHVRWVFAKLCFGPCYRHYYICINFFRLVSSFIKKLILK